MTKVKVVQKHYFLIITANMAWMLRLFESLMPNDGRVVSNFFIQILKSEDITIYGKGE